MQQLGLRGGGTGKNGIGAGVERLGHALDVAALARGVPAFVHDHERDALLVHLHLQPVEALLLGLELDLVRLGVERERVVDALEARRVVHLTEPRNARSAGGSSGCGGFRLLAHARLLFGRTAEQGRFIESAGGVGLRLGRRYGGFGVGRRLERARKRVHQRLGDLQVGAALVLAVHEMPWGEREVAALQQVVVQAVRLLVVADGGQLVLAHAPARGRIVMQAREALLLRLLRDVHEELDHKVTVVG